MTGGALSMTGERLDLSGEGDDARLFLLEMTVRVQQVEDGRDETFDPVATAGEAGKTIKETGRSIRFPDFQDPQHFPFGEQGPQLRIRVDAPGHPPRCCDDLRPGSIAEWESEGHLVHQPIHRERKRVNAS